MSDFLHQVVRFYLGFAMTCAVAIPLFYLLRRGWPVQQQPSWNGDIRTNFAFALALPFINRLSGFVVMGVLGLTVVLRGHAPSIDHIINLVPRSPLRNLPHGAQVALAFLVTDFASYVSHRLDHTRMLWRFHAVHHSPRTLDWSSGVRQHPFSIAFETLFEPLLFFGIDPELAVIPVMVGRLHNFFVHTNVRWRFGPLRYVFVSPLMHRWHHADVPEIYNKNFGFIFSFWDVLFGTYYDPPRDVMPVRLGVADAPSGFWRLMAYPFRRAPRSAPSVVATTP